MVKTTRQPTRQSRGKNLEEQAMPKEVRVQPRTPLRRAASKTALKQMQILLGDSKADDSDDDVIAIDPPIAPPPVKKKYKLSHRKSSDGNDRDVIVLKSIQPHRTNNNAALETLFDLECTVEELTVAQKQRKEQLLKEEKEIETKCEQLKKAGNAEVIYEGTWVTAMEIAEQLQNIITSATQPPPPPVAATAGNQNVMLQQAAAAGGAALPPNFRLVMDPRLGVIVGAVSAPLGGGAAANQTAGAAPPLQLYQLPVEQQLSQQQPQTKTPPSTRTRRAAARGSGTAASQHATKASPSTVGAQQHQQQPQQKQVVSQKGNASGPAKGTIQVKSGLGKQPGAVQVKTTAQLKAVPQLGAATTRGAAAAQQSTISTRGRASSSSAAAVVAAPPPPAAVSRPPSENNVEGGLNMGLGGGGPGNQKQTRSVVDLTAMDDVAGGSGGGGGGRPLPDSREVSFNKLQGRTYPSLVVVARPHLRVKDLSVDRSKLDVKVKSVLMYPPTKFTEWLIQQGLVRSEQKCSAHPANHLKLGMYSDATKFPYSGGYVWISECCPQKFVSVFSGSLFEGSQHPPMAILKLLYHWCCQTIVQNVTQWVKVDNLYVKGMYAWLRSVCTVALHTHLKPLGGPGVRVQVGVISLGTTSQDGNQRQVKVEVLGILEMPSKQIRLRAVEPLTEAERNYKKRFTKILEPVCAWVHKGSHIVTDLTVDKATLQSLGFPYVTQTTSTDYNNSNIAIMEYLRRIVPRMFQNTLSLLSRQIIQQFLDELVWRETYGTTVMQCFDNIVQHLSEQTRHDGGGGGGGAQQSLILRLSKVAANPFKNWSIPVTPGNGSGGVAQQPQQQQQSKTVATVVSTVPGTSQAEPGGRKNYGGRGGRKQGPSSASSSAAAAVASATAAPVAAAASAAAAPPAPVVVQDHLPRPTKSTSPDVPEQMVPLENYYYGTINGSLFNSPASKKQELAIKCGYCKGLFSNNISLMNHLFKHAHNVSNDVLLCRYCLTLVPTANDLNKHIAISHPDETKFDNAFMCLICETQFMNPFILGKHMSKEHCPSELPYLCGTCGYRCSNHKQAVDHFYSRHEGGTTIQCPFCLKSTTVYSSGRNIVQNLNFFIQHLQKHQKKHLAKRCSRCTLWFVQKELLKDHQINMHSSQRGKPGLMPGFAPRNGVMVPKSKMDRCPDDAKEINFNVLQINVANGLLTCLECARPLNAPKHFTSFEGCQNSNCQYSTCCSTSMQEHASKCKKLNAELPEDKLPYKMFCVCGFSEIQGNLMAKHVAICEKKSAYPSVEGARAATVTRSMLDVLGLVRKPDESSSSSSSSSSARKKSGADAANDDDDDDVQLLELKEVVKHTSGGNSSRRGGGSGGGRSRKSLLMDGGGRKKRSRSSSSANSNREEDDNNADEGKATTTEKTSSGTREKGVVVLNSDDESSSNSSSSTQPQQQKHKKRRKLSTPTTTAATTAGGEVDELTGTNNKSDEDNSRQANDEGDRTTTTTPTSQKEDNNGDEDDTAMETKFQDTIEIEEGILQPSPETASSPAPATPPSPRQQERQEEETEKDSQQQEQREHQKSMVEDEDEDDGSSAVDAAAAAAAAAIHEETEKESSHTEEQQEEETDAHEERPQEKEHVKSPTTAAAFDNDVEMTEEVSAAVASSPPSSADVAAADDDNDGDHGDDGEEERVTTTTDDTTTIADVDHDITSKADDDAATASDFTVTETTTTTTLTSEDVTTSPPEVRVGDGVTGGFLSDDVTTTTTTTTTTARDGDNDGDDVITDTAPSSVSVDTTTDAAAAAATFATATPNDEDDDNALATDDVTDDDATSAANVVATTTSPAPLVSNDNDDDDAAVAGEADDDDDNDVLPATETAASPKENDDDGEVTKPASLSSAPEENVPRESSPSSPAVDQFSDEDNLLEAEDIEMRDITSTTTVTNDAADDHGKTTENTSADETATAAAASDQNAQVAMVTAPALSSNTISPATNNDDDDDDLFSAMETFN